MSKAKKFKENLEKVEAAVQQHVDGHWYRVTQLQEIGTGAHHKDRDVVYAYSYLMVIRKKALHFTLDGHGLITSYPENIVETVEAEIREKEGSEEAVSLNEEPVSQNEEDENEASGEQATPSADNNGGGPSHANTGGRSKSTNTLARAPAQPVTATPSADNNGGGPSHANTNGRSKSTNTLTRGPAQPVTDGARPVADNVTPAKRTATNREEARADGKKPRTGTGAGSGAGPDNAAASGRRASEKGSDKAAAPSGATAPGGATQRAPAAPAVPGAKQLPIPRLASRAPAAPLVAAAEGGAERASRAAEVMAAVRANGVSEHRVVLAQAALDTAHEALEALQARLRELEPEVDEAHSELTAALAARERTMQTVVQLGMQMASE